MSSSKQPPTSEKLMVSLVNANLPIHHGQRLSLSKLCCGSQESSLFLQIPRQATISPVQEAIDSSQILCEIQSISTDFGSFLLTPTNTLIGKDSNLYVTTPVDPLFFLLQHAPSSEQWQPWDQIVESMSATIRSILPSDKNQLMHLFARMAVTEDEVYYKFSVKKSLDWLQQKFIVLQAVLKQQQTKAQNSNPNSTSNSNGRSSIANNFCLGKQATAASTTMTAEALKEEQTRQQATREERLNERCRTDAAQIICDYLNEEWRQRFLAHVNLDANALQPKKAPVTAATKRLTPAADVPMPPPAKKSKPPVKVSSASQKLAKVNTKGMQKMSFFFAKKENASKN